MQPANITNALIVAERYAMIDGDHHKQWVIDQMIRALLGDEMYASWREAYAAASGEGYEPWSEGVAP